MEINDDYIVHVVVDIGKDIHNTAIYVKDFDTTTYEYAIVKSVLMSKYRYELDKLREDGLAKTEKEYLADVFDFVISITLPSPNSIMRPNIIDSCNKLIDSGAEYTAKYGDLLGRKYHD